ncbi:hypothetical protein INR49_026167 [Caranx melampygus]|nr:hypothetical protein INR49_026167 [Caranx melampygus]
MMGCLRHCSLSGKLSGEQEGKSQFLDQAALTQLTAIGGHVAPAGHHAVLVGRWAASGKSHGLDVAVEGGGTAQFDQHDVVVQVVAVVLWVLDHFGAIDPLLSALVHSNVVLAKTDLDTTEKPGKTAAATQEKMQRQRMMTVSLNLRDRTPSVVQ